MRSQISLTFAKKMWVRKNNANPCSMIASLEVSVRDTVYN